VLEAEFEAELEHSYLAQLPLHYQQEALQALLLGIPFSHGGTQTAGSEGKSSSFGVGGAGSFHM